MIESKGTVTRQAHVDIPAGTVEEEYARNGFSGRYAHLYRTAPMVNWTRIEGELRPRSYQLARLPHLGGDYTASRTAFLRNDDCVLRYATLRTEMPYWFRNADGDEILFVHNGSGRIETDYGPLTYRTGDYLVIPRGTVYRLLPQVETKLLVIETAGEVRLPDRGLIGQHALFDPSVIQTPCPEPVLSDPATNGSSEYEIRVQRLGRITSLFYPFHPMNVVGWKGDLTVWQINVDDIRPVMSERYHLPPTAHATFVADNVVIATFLPRGLETGDPGALKVPFYHANIDYDEVLFYHAGSFFSRAGVGPGMVTFHPQGLHHGPQPQAVAASRAKERTDEQAVMIDTRRPLAICPEAEVAENTEYWKSWQTPRPATETSETTTTRTEGEAPATPQEVTR